MSDVEGVLVVEVEVEMSDVEGDLVVEVELKMLDVEVGALAVFVLEFGVFSLSP